MSRSVGIAARGAALAMIFALAFVAASRAAEPKNVKGLYLTANYPAMTVVAGHTATIPLKLRNYGMPPEPVTLTLAGLPKGWKARFLGNDQVIHAAMATPDDAVDLKLRLDVPKYDETEAVKLVVHAEGTNQRAELPLKLSLGDNLPVALSLKPDLPSLSGAPTADFKYTLAVNNDSGKDLLVSLAASAPRGFQTSFTKEYDSQEIASLPVKAGHSENVSMKVSPPPDISAGTYHIQARIAAAGASADAPLEMKVTGQPSISLTTPDDRLSGDAEAGKETPITLVVANTGSAPARDISLSANAPSKWKVTFEPKKIALLAPRAHRTVTALLTPAAKAIAGDYMATLRANADGGSDSSTDYRVTVTTSTLWGMIGVVIIAIALVAAMGAVWRFGRR